MSQSSADTAKENTGRLIEAALAYAARGWPVFPCSPQTKAPLLGNDKDEAGKPIPKTGGVKKASTDEATIRGWWSRWPKALIGVATGHGRLFVVDFDPRVDEATGEAFTLERLKGELEAQMGCALPASLTSITQSGGVHIWLTWPEDDGDPIRNRGNLPLHVDVRGLGGYVIAPPSVMASGRDYHWLRRDGETHDPARTRISEAPAALIEILRTPGGAKGKGGAAAGEGGSSRVSTISRQSGGLDTNGEGGARRRVSSDDPVDAARRKWALAALDSAISELGGSRQGTRGQDLNRLGFKLGTIVGAGYLDRAMAIAGLVSACGSNGLAATDGHEAVQANAERAVRDGEGQPRDMSDVGALAGRGGSSGNAGSAAGWREFAPAEPAAQTRPAAAAASPTTLPDGSLPPSPPTAREAAQLERMALAWVKRRMRQMLGEDAKVAQGVAYGIGRRLSADLLPLTCKTRSALMSAGLLIARDPELIKSFEAGFARGFDIEPMRLTLRCARLPLTDFGIAERFNLRFGQDFLYTTAKGWHGFDARRWAMLDQDEKNAPAELIGAIWKTIRAIQDEADAIEATGDREHGLDFAYFRGKQLRWHHQDVAAFGRQSETTGKPEGVQKLARRWLTVPIERFDCDPLAINVLNGTLRFARERDGDGRWRARCWLEPHNRTHLNTKLAPVTYGEDAECPKYDDFIAWAHPDAAMRRYLRQVMGYTFTGLTGEQKAWFHYGKGANGKSTAFDIWAYSAGDYAGVIGIESFLDQGVKKRGDAASPDLARLGGVRFLRTSEPARGAKLDEALIKALTGGEPVAVRALHRGFFDLTPSFKPHIAGNYQPEIPGTDEGIWRRMKLVPWLQHRAANERNENLVTEMKAEADGVFRWMVQGLLDWLENGLVEPSIVTEATAEYRDNSDPLARFLRMCVVEDPASRIQSSELHDVFCAWCKAVGEREWTNKGLAGAMRDKGFSKKQSNGMQWLGIRLIKGVSDFVDHEGRVKPIEDDGAPVAAQAPGGAPGWDDLPDWDGDPGP